MVSIVLMARPAERSNLHSVPAQLSGDHSQVSTRLQHRALQLVPVVLEIRRLGADIALVPASWTARGHGRDARKRASRITFLLPDVAGPALAGI
jgi:hypothetical protein